VEEYTPSQTGGETFGVGELVVWDDSNNTIDRAGTDPTAIVGISEVDSEKARVLTPNGKIPIRTLTPESVVAMASATDYVEATHRQQIYGVTRDSNGRWLVDVAKLTTFARVLVVDGIPVNFGPGQGNVWFVKFLAEFLANDGILT
jgi:hypothetical protein